MRQFFNIFPIFLLCLWGTACTKAPQPITLQKQEVLHVYTWSNYFSSDAIKKFEETAHAKVEFSYFSSNEELMAKLQAGAKGYDVIVPSGYVVRALISLGILLPLQSELWPELKNLSPQFRAPVYDAHHEYSVPFVWGISGLAVNRAKV